jgi:L-ascorbate metabolism protein UlaG (beta-lactamase superfamily)
MTSENRRDSYRSGTQPALTGLRFLNPEPVKHHTAWDLVKWAVTGRRERWPRPVPVASGDTPPSRVGRGELFYLVVNHATVLIQTDSLNMLTDPIWSKHPSLVSWAGPRRSHLPGITLDQLPPIDLVLLTHNHYDHMDIPTLKRLADRDNPMMVAGLGNARTLTRHSLINIKELDWWGKTRVSDVTVHFTPARHFCRRGLFDYNRSLWGSFVIETSRGPLFFAGDTGYGVFFEHIYHRFGPMALAFVPIGAYRPRWMMGSVHLDPEEAWQVHRVLAARRSVGIHFGTFQLTDEGMGEPAARIQKIATADIDQTGEFVVPRFGELVVVQ